jgi:hypothetical protein
MENNFDKSCQTAFHADDDHDLAAIKSNFSDNVIGLPYVF